MGVAIRAKELAEAAHSVPYSEGNLKKALAKLRALLVAPEELRQVPTILAEAGVRFVIVEFLPRKNRWRGFLAE